MIPYDKTVCRLGEGPLWHPTRAQLYWFDILSCTLNTVESGQHRRWTFDENVSAAGWVDDNHLLIASETRLFRFNLETGTSEDVLPLEADKKETRSNDGRADPYGGFWIGTMPKSGDKPIGAFYRYYKGQISTLFEGLSIPNACCFTPDGTEAVFCDSAKNQVRRVAWDQEGWPVSEPFVWMDLSGEGFGVDGAVMDADGNFWNAQWGAARIACYSPDGTLLHTVPVAGKQSSCPAFGGKDLSTLFCTTAAEGLGEAELQASESNGMTFIQENAGIGQAEHRVLL